MSEIPGGTSTGGGSATPPAPASAAGASSKVAGPAWALIIVAGIGIALQVVGMLAKLLGISLLGSELGGNRPQALAILSGGLGIAIGIVGIAIGVVILVGAIKMKALEGYGLAMAVSILAMIPCVSPCCLLGLPIGIWSLVVLLDPGVKSSFR